MHAAHSIYSLYCYNYITHAIEIIIMPQLLILLPDLDLLSESDLMSSDDEPCQLDYSGVANCESDSEGM